MKFEEVTEKDKIKYNNTVHHPLQSFEWGAFREKTGVGVVRRAYREKTNLASGFTFTLHGIPKTPYNIGYLPKGHLPTKEELREIVEIGRKNKCVFVQIEPNVIRRKIHDLGFKNENEKEIKRFEELIKNSNFDIRESFHPLFTKYNFILDITPDEEDLLASFHSKTRYNIRVAKNKHDVRIVFDSRREAFVDYLKLLEETTSRQGFYAHTPSYHRQLFETIPHEHSAEQMSYHIARALYTDSSGASHTLAAWVLFAFGNTLYYPYGASSQLYRFTMASNLICWEAILFGKKLGLEKFDMWGALSDTPEERDPWYGFHKFKSGYNPTHIEYVGSYDVVINPALYNFYKVADRARWAYLGMRKRLG